MDTSLYLPLQRTGICASKIKVVESPQSSSHSQLETLAISPRRRRSPPATMAGMASRSEGKTTGDKGYCSVIYSPYPQSSPLPPRLTDLFQQFGLDKIRAIMNSSDGKTFEQKIDKLREEMSAFERARNEFFVEGEDVDEDDEDDEDDDVDVDESDRKVGKLLDDDKKPDITKRPHTPIGDEVECKKPKIAEGSRCQGEEPGAGGIKNSSW
ncbi:nucleosome assembly protein 1;3-like isoform X2 [Triticum aestivum]|nr:nucleosome assembly protein 1;3-like isoform X2 [Triticum aestivum]XP_044392697.1 nucleosome assembly protein 1;3-like isoform X2 [Triticum aestivum]